MPEKKLVVESARDLGPQLTDNNRGMVGQDGSYSIPLGDGKSFWFFGDTLFGSRVHGESLWFPGGKPLPPADMSGRNSIELMLTNTALILDRKTGAEGLKNYEYILDKDGGVKQLIGQIEGENKDDHRIWCMHGCEIGENFYLYYIKVTMQAEGPLPVNFYENGSGLAVGSRADWEFKRIPGKDGTLFWTADEPQFGTTVLPHEETGFVYVYGVTKNREGIQSTYLARVGFEDIENYSEYEYLISAPSEPPEWSRDVTKAVPVFQYAPNEMSVSYNPYLGCYLAVHSYDLTGQIVGRTAPNPWGPWSEPAVFWTVKPEYEFPPPYEPLIYSGKEHPEISGEGGRILYITYIEFEEYFPHLIEVTLGG